MPAINNYRLLIENLPVRSQCFTTKRSTWTKAERAIPWLKEINDELFSGNALLTVSRQDVFESKNAFRAFILKTLYWGYCNGMRGNHFIKILTSVEKLETLCETLESADISDSDFLIVKEQFRNITGIGLSTYSKFLYFLEVKINGNPSLILDQRLLDVFRSGHYHDLHELSGINDYNKEARYPSYLKLMKQIATRLEVRSDSIEQFLFIFGSSLKSTVVPNNKIDQMWDGFCPESLMKGKQVRMRLNLSDLFESVETGLQISVMSGIQAVILNSRGNGQFRAMPKYADEVENGEMLSPQNIDRPPFNEPATVFLNSAEIESYINQIKP